MAELKPKPSLSGSASNQISSSELGQRVAVLRRFKELLKAQRDRFNAYLNALDKQKDVIESGTADDLLHHVELEEKIVEDIFSIQKVIDPLEKMYQSIKLKPAKSASANAIAFANENAGEEEVTSLKAALEGLKSEAVVRSERNRDLLSKRMAELRAEIQLLRNSNAYARRKFDSEPTPSLVDLKG